MYSVDPPGPCYKKPFPLYYYNLPKLPPLKTPKKLEFKKPPKIAVKLNNATKLRDKIIKDYSTRVEPVFDYTEMSEETLKAMGREPQHLPPDTKTSQYRYKWVRDIPVVSCRFTEHVMMHRKPPFTFGQAKCGLFRLRNLVVHEPVIEQESDEETETDLLPSILQ